MAAVVPDPSVLCSTMVLMTQRKPIIPNIEVRRRITTQHKVAVREEVVVRAGLVRA